jgi:hypothetical protein
MVLKAQVVKVFFYDFLSLKRVTMNDISIHPETVLNEILAKGNRKDKEDKIKALYDTCLQEYNRRSKGGDLSLANISRLAEIKGLFKARSIYNRQSIDYRRVIEAWSQYGGPIVNVKSKEVNSKYKYESYLSKISDPVVRSLCQMAFIERDKLKVQLDILKGHANITINLQNKYNLSETSFKNKIVNFGENLTNSEIEALKSAISPNFLATKGWEEGSVGEVLDKKTKRFIFNPGFITGIRKIIDATKLK